MVNIVIKPHPISGKPRAQETDFEGIPKVVRVLPTSDAVRKFIKHGVTKVGFLAEGSAEWPFDQFTRNRIRDGDVTIEQATEHGARALPRSRHSESSKT
jgi:hypothetical protein